MQVSAEIRWFWKGAAPEPLKAWFLDTGGNRPVAGGGMRPRTDTYLRDGSTAELGIKQRGKPGSSPLLIEVKGLVVKEWGALDARPIAGVAELWTKWTSKTIELSAPNTVAVEKLRWLRKYDTSSDVNEIPLHLDESPLRQCALPATGCNVELTRVDVAGQTWWTFGLESFGVIDAVGPSLTRTAVALVRAGIPSLDNGLPLSYPAWLSGHVVRVE